jgi:hypothetical protein
MTVYDVVSVVCGCFFRLLLRTVSSCYGLVLLFPRRFLQFGIRCVWSGALFYGGTRIMLAALCSRTAVLVLFTWFLYEGCQCSDVIVRKNGYNGC